VTTPHPVSRSHAAAWIRRPRETQGRIARIAWDGDAVVCFGDGQFADLRDGEHVFVDVGTGSGTLQDEFAATVHEVVGSEVSDEVLLALVEYLPLGGTPEAVEQSLAKLREGRLLRLTTG
jgi:hypothetical protein